MKSCTLLLLFVLGFLVTEMDAHPVVSTADWNTNADTLIDAEEKLNDPAKLLIFLVTYNFDLMNTAAVARREDDRQKLVTFLTVAYFNSKLARQMLGDIKGQITDFDHIELELRQSTESIRDQLLRLGFTVNGGALVQGFKDYRESFGRHNGLVLRSP